MHLKRENKTIHWSTAKRLHKNKRKTSKAFRQSEWIQDRDARWMFIWKYCFNFPVANRSWPKTRSKQIRLERVSANQRLVLETNKWLASGRSTSFIYLWNSNWHGDSETKEKVEHWCASFNYVDLCLSQTMGSGLSAFAPKIIYLVINGSLHKVGNISSLRFNFTLWKILITSMSSEYEVKNLICNLANAPK